MSWEGEESFDSLYRRAPFIGVVWNPIPSISEVCLRLSSTCSWTKYSIINHLGALSSHTKPHCGQQAGRRSAHRSSSGSGERGGHRDPARPSRRPAGARGLAQDVSARFARAKAGCRWGQVSKLWSHRFDYGPGTATRSWHKGSHLMDVFAHSVNRPGGLPACPATSSPRPPGARLLHVPSRGELRERAVSGPSFPAPHPAFACGFSPFHIHGFLPSLPLHIHHQPIIYQPTCPSSVNHVSITCPLWVYHLAPVYPSRIAHLSLL